MLSTSTGLPFAITATSADARFRLGELYEVYDATYGNQVYRYIQNKSGGTMAQGVGTMQENGTDLYEAGLAGAATATARMLGVVQQTAGIADNYYGFVLCNGRGKVKASAANITANTALKAVASGLFTDGVIGTDELPVFAHEAATSGNLATATIRCL